MASSELPHGSGQQSSSWGNDATASITPVGVDVGERTLVAAAPVHGRPDDALMIDGDHVRESFDHLRAACVTLRALDSHQHTAVDTSSAETALVAAFWKRLKGQLHDAAARAVRYAREYPSAVLVLEDDLPYGGRPLWEHRYITGNLGTWLLPVLQDALVAKATDAGLPVAWVSPVNTSRECHRCGELGDRVGREFRCTTDACPVDRVDADASAAVSIAKRV